jgi:hypothetical protein
MPYPYQQQPAIAGIRKIFPVGLPGQTQPFDHKQKQETTGASKPNEPPPEQCNNYSNRIILIILIMQPFRQFMRHF